MNNTDEQLDQIDNHPEPAVATGRRRRRAHARAAGSARSSGQAPTVDRSRLGAANRRRGAEAERKVAAWLRGNGFPGAERAVRTAYTAGGRTVVDPGDITGLPAIVVQVKDDVSNAVGAWLAETEQQRLGAPGAAPADLGLLVVRRRGKANVGRWWAWLPVEQLVDLVAGTRTPAGSRPVRMELGDLVPLLRAAGYGEPLAEVAR